MKTRAWIPVLGAAFLLLVVGRAQGGMVTYNFSGTIDTVYFDSQNALQGLVVEDATAFSGRFSYDDSATDFQSESYYGHFAAPEVFEVNIGSLSLTTGPAPAGAPDNKNQILLDNDGEDAFGTIKENGLLSLGSPTSVLTGFNLFSTSETVFDSDDLTSVDLSDLSQFDSGAVFYVQSNEGADFQFAFGGTIQSMTLATVPEPSSLVAFGMTGLLLTGVSTRRRRSAITK
ncbi:MAG: PEP-CTERM sorting domain-containing protein [Planctomycetota bacterium]